MKKLYSCWIIVGLSCVCLLFWGYYSLKQVMVKTGSGLRSDCDEEVSLKTRPMQPLEFFAYIPPADWTKYMMGDDFYISVPPTVELRNSDDLYTQMVSHVDWCGRKINTSTPVFQQKELAVMNSSSFQTYCRIMLDVERGRPGDYPKSTEYIELTEQDIRDFQEIAEADLAGTEFEVVDRPAVRLVKIEGIYGVRVEYIREGSENHFAHVSHYFFFNDDKMARVILSYRLSDACKWKLDFSNVVRTFKWKN